MKKNEIRKSIACLRESISDEQQKRNSAKISETFFALERVKSAGLFSFYMGYGKEVKTDAMIKKILLQDKRIALPRVNTMDMEHMEFYEIWSLNDLKTGYKGIPEPLGMEVLKDIPGIMVLPGVAFDCSKNRIGYGKGFYDKYIGHMVDRSATYLIAFAHECQIVEKIDADEFDIKPDMIITEERIIC